MLRLGTFDRLLHVVENLPDVPENGSGVQRRVDGSHDALFRVVLRHRHRLESGGLQFKNVG